MTTADQLAIVEQKMASDQVKALVLAEGGLVKDWMKSQRLLVVVKKSKTHALFVFMITCSPISNPDDLTLDTAMRIDQDFSVDIDAGDAVIIKISSGKASPDLMFEMLPGYHTQNFVAEMFRLKEPSQVSLANNATESDYSWMEKYQKVNVPKSEETSTGLAKLNLNKDEGKSSFHANDPSIQDMESPEATINRQDIATGVAPIAARESVIKYQMALKEDQYTNITNFTLFIGTWNVNGQSPDGPVNSWLSIDDEPPDMYVIGFQELDLSKEAFVFNESLKEEEWNAVVEASLHPKSKYVKIKLIRLVGMMMLVFVKDGHKHAIKNVAAESVGTGIMGKLGNKGGVSVRIDFHNTSVCFVNSHLAAHVTEFERRNQDYHDICNRMVFTQFAPVKCIKDHDMVFWLGDLNYRITDLDATSVKAFLAENDLAALLKIDQFFQQRQMRKAFAGYKEGPITFMPTYKYDTGTDNWDSSEKERAPAWTDRILWKGDQIQQTAYRSHMELKTSDHKPVSSILNIGIKVIDPSKYRKIYEDVIKKLDRLENEFLPQVTVDTTEIMFDTIKFLESSAKNLTVANTGQVPVQFEFIKKLNESHICKPWLTVEPSTGFIMPGEKCDVTLEIFVNKKTAGPLTSGQDQLYEILVLHLLNGKDIFITVNGKYQKSVFGASINALVQMTVPICELSVGALIEMEGFKERTDRDVKEEGEKSRKESYPVPKELWFLCDLISTLGLDTENVFLQSGLRSEVLFLRDWLDTGLPVDRPSVSIHSAAETLLMFLESLREPIVPYSLYSRCLEASHNYLQCKQIVSQLPFHHKQVFNYLTAFLREVIRHSAKNGVDPKILATLFSSIFLRDPPGMNLGMGIKAKNNQQVLDNKKARFIYHFIVNEQEL